MTICEDCMEDNDHCVEPVIFWRPSACSSLTPCYSMLQLVAPVSNGVALQQQSCRCPCRSLKPQADRHSRQAQHMGKKKLTLPTQPAFVELRQLLPLPKLKTYALQRQCPAMTSLLRMTGLGAVPWLVAFSIRPAFPRHVDPLGPTLPALAMLNGSRLPARRR